MNTEDIHKPKQDKRSYKAFELSNKLNVFIIHDPETEKSACSFNVGVGAALDPKTHQGAAHFLEHMLFQGSGKYPGANEYMDFMNNNGGACNAFTSLTETNYHFNCSNQAFEEGLDRIAQFFIEPKFSKESAEKEVNAVDSEFNMSLQNDAWHFYNLLFRLSEENSSLHRFMCGNKKTLEVEGMRDHLLDFHKKWYSANIMHLVILSNHSVADMEKWAIEKFSPIKNFDVEVPFLGDPAPFPPGRLGKIVRYVPVQDEDKLVMFWILPLCQNEWKSKPLDYFSHLIGHEGENSLLSYLKQQGLALELSTGVDHEMDSISTFQIDITLSEKGLKDYNKVIEAIYQYAHKLREAGPQNYVFEEVRDIGIMNYEFQSKQDQLSECVAIAQKFKLFNNDNIKEMLRQRYVADIFNEELTKKYADLLCQSDNVGIFMSSKKFEKDSETFETAEFYGTKYKQTAIDEELQNMINKPNCVITSKKLDLPPPNTMIPKNFDVLAENKALSEKATLIFQDENTDLWYRKDDQYKQPKGIVQMRIATKDNGYGNSIEGRLFAQIWHRVLDEHLKEYTYMAEQATLSFSTTVNINDLDIQWSGFNDSMPNFIKETLIKIGQMKDADTREIFNQVKEKTMVDWKNSYLHQSYQQMFQHLTHWVNEHSYEARLQRVLLENYTYEQFSEQLKSWLKNGRFVWLVTGNFTEEQAKGFVDQQRLGLPMGPLAVDELVEVRVINPVGNHKVSMKLVDDKNDNSAFISLFQHNIGVDDIKSELTFGILAKYINQPFFNELRTDQQLGYVVHSQLYKPREIQGLMFLIQSDKHSSEYCVDASNKFFVDLKKKVNEISDEDFEVQKASLHTDLAEKDVNIAKAHARSWAQISNHRYIFDKQAQQIKLLQEVTKQEFIDCFNALFFGNQLRRVDFELDSVAHVEENAKCALTTKDHEIYQGQRKEWGSVDEFVKEVGYHGDAILANYKKFHGAK